MTRLRTSGGRARLRRRLRLGLVALAVVLIVPVLAPDPAVAAGFRGQAPYRWQWTSWACTLKSDGAGGWLISANVNVNMYADATHNSNAILWQAVLATQDDNGNWKALDNTDIAEYSAYFKKGVATTYRNGYRISNYALPITASGYPVALHFKIQWRRNYKPSHAPDFWKTKKQSADFYPKLLSEFTGSLVFGRKGWLLGTGCDYR